MGISVTPKEDRRQNSKKLKKQNFKTEAAIPEIPQGIALHARPTSTSG